MSHSTNIRIFNYETYIKQWLKRGYHIDDVIKTGGLTRLHLAAEEGNVEKISVLLNYGANINVRDNLGSTPLYDSIIYNHFEVYKELILRGADINKIDERDTPIIYLIARRVNDRRFIDLLKSIGVDFNQQDTNGDTALHMFVMLKFKNGEIIQALLDHGARTDIPNNKGQTVIDLSVNIDSRFSSILIEHRDQLEHKEPDLEYD